MPGGDRTGPMGYGPMTGRGMGRCARPGSGRWSGRVGAYMYGWGRGRGWRNRYWATGSPGWARPGWSGRWTAPPPVPEWAPAEGELTGLRQYAAGLEEELARIKSRLAEMEKKQKAFPPSEG